MRSRTPICFNLIVQIHRFKNSWLKVSAICFYLAVDFAVSLQYNIKLEPNLCLVKSSFLYSYKLFVMINVLRVEGSFIPSQKLVLNLTFNRLPRIRTGSDRNTHTACRSVCGATKEGWELSWMVSDLNGVVNVRLRSGRGGEQGPHRGSKLA